MRIKDNKKKAYTLAEIMIVILILTIIFAAFAPFFTKRTMTNYGSRYNVWQYANRTAFDAYSDPGKATNTAQLFFGVTPNDRSDVTSTLLPSSKIVVRSGYVTSTKMLQRQIQFRYGRTGEKDAGTFAGTWFMNGKNLFLGSAYPTVNLTNTGAMNNVAIGVGALNNVTTSKGNTAVGYNALSVASTSKNNLAIGAYAGSNTNGNDNTLVGYYAGKSTTGSNQTAIGYMAMGQSSGSPSGINTYIGAWAGNNVSSSSYANVGIGTYTMANSSVSGHHNVAVGAYALKNLTSGSYNVAIGYNACGEVTTGSRKTCIGYNSGPHERTTADFLGGRTDDIERTYIGSKPYNFGGDAVLEIHNPNPNPEDSQTNKVPVNSGIPAITGILSSENRNGRNASGDGSGSVSNTTTIVNGNLIVRGRPYFTTGATLHHFHDDNILPDRAPVRYYGYLYESDTNYAKCATTYATYSFNSKCINMNTSTSDRRLKNIGTRYTYGLDKINELKVYNYTFKDDKNKSPHVGVIAQELQKVFPNSVFKGTDGYLRIRWDEMFYAVINSIKELDAKVVALVKRTTNVETQISKLEKENIELKYQVENLASRVNKLKAQ
ncbi:tail fiber domain-containing protein [bacterium]|nr:tail fiber domain-containing protein [bacterium]